MPIGSLDREGKHWRKRWPKGTPCCYVAIQIPDGGLLQVETKLTRSQLDEMLRCLGLKE